MKFPSSFLTLPGSSLAAFPAMWLAALVLAMVSAVSATPVVTNPTLSFVGTTEADVSATVTDLGGGRSLERGFVYAAAATNPDPLLGGAGVLKALKLGRVGSFTATVPNLSPETTYAVKSFIRTDLATAYSSVLFFTTDTIVSFNSGVGTVVNRSITAGETQGFDLHLPDSSMASFQGTGASGSMTWELLDVLGIVVAAGSGDVSFTGALEWGDYQLRVSNPGVTSETFSLNLDIATAAAPLPDISVGLDATAPSGQDIYGPPSPDQFVLATTTLANARDFFFLVDNDGPLPDSMRISASAPNNLFKVSYFIAGKNQTAAAIAGIANTVRIGPDDAPVSVRAKISPDKTNTRIRDSEIVGGRRRTIYGSESFFGTMRVTSNSDYTISDSATFQLNTLP